MEIVLVDEVSMALTYSRISPDPAGREYVAVAAAYDQDGHQQQRHLRDLFRIGHGVAIGLVVLVGYFFSRQALRPLDKLSGQLQRPITNQPFRLRPDNSQDEAGVLARA